MKTPLFYIPLIAILILTFSCSGIKKTYQSNDINLKEIKRIAFGSCSHQDKKQKILKSVVDKYPDLFIYLGDNIYGDSKDINIIKQKYAKLAKKKEFISLRSSCKILATWDDHDYGWNDAGKYYPLKEESKNLFLEFWNEPKSSARREHSGIYHSMIYGSENKKVQIILLDTRTFRDNLKTKKGNGPGSNSYVKNTDADSTFLGEQQWIWLADQLKKDANIRIIASSNQFSHEHNGHESWTNVPHERQKMLTLIKTLNAEGVIFISGDVHYGEISCLKQDGLYPIYDVTSSGLTQGWHNTSLNKNRLGEPVRKNNFGLIEIDWTTDPIIRLKLCDKKGKTKGVYALMLSDLRL